MYIVVFIWAVLCTC